MRQELQPSSQSLEPSEQQLLHLTPLQNFPRLLTASFLPPPSYSTASMHEALAVSVCSVNVQQKTLVLAKHMGGNLATASR